MSGTNKILSLLLALLLVGSNMAISAHVSSHTNSHPGSCYLCIHPGGSDSAIAIEASALFITPVVFTFNHSYATTLVLPLNLHNQQSRAPPSVS